MPRYQARARLHGLQFAIYLLTRADYTIVTPTPYPISDIRIAYTTYLDVAIASAKDSNYNSTRVSFRLLSTNVAACDILLPKKIPSSKIYRILRKPFTERHEAGKFVNYGSMIVQERGKGEGEDIRMKIKLEQFPHIHAASGGKRESER